MWHVRAETFALRNTPTASVFSTLSPQIRYTPVVAQTCATVGEVAAKWRWRARQPQHPKFHNNEKGRHARCEALHAPYLPILRSVVLRGNIASVQSGFSWYDEVTKEGLEDANISTVSVMLFRARR